MNAALLITLLKFASQIHPGEATQWVPLALLGVTALAIWLAILAVQLATLIVQQQNKRKR